MRRTAGWIAWWSLNTVALGVLFTWLYNNTGHSVFAAALVTAVWGPRTLARRRAARALP
jgi:hypothetical protein